MDRICELVDSFGQECGIGGCGEFRTIAVRLLLETPEGETGLYTLPLCRDHLIAFLDDWAFARLGRSSLYDLNLRKVVEE